jgi:putative tryptophan/tyrosine transport system substrate-binding protein
MRRRAFLSHFGCAAIASPIMAHARQSGLPVVGLLSSGTPEESLANITSFRKGLSEMGFVEGRNLNIESRFANNDYAMPQLAAELVRLRVGVIAALSGGSGAAAARSATTTIPIVFSTVGDPVEAGIVASLNRPGGNITGVTSLGTELSGKRLGLLAELLPQARRFAVLLDPRAFTANTQIRDIKTAAAGLDRQVDILTASTIAEIDAAFATLVRNKIEGLQVLPVQLLAARRVQIITLSARHAIPTIYATRVDAKAGGLMSYGTLVEGIARQVGLYTGRILKGEKPADLPVMQPTKFEFVINLQTARTLGIEIPPTLLALADEVIE